MVCALKYNYCRNLSTTIINYLHRSDKLFIIGVRYINCLVINWDNNHFPRDNPNLEAGLIKIRDIVVLNSPLLLTPFKLRKVCLYILHNMCA